ncbi:MAG: methyltransferase family protein [Planctomycetota bacterium]
MKHPFRRKNLNPRLLPIYGFAAVAFAIAEPTAIGLAIGGALIGAGMALRVWGAGHLVKNEYLTVSGPYAHLRHPLYAGALLLGVGFAVIAGGVALVLVLAGLAPLFFLYYLPYKDRIESARLERRYGAAFTAYRAEVRRLVPTLAPWRPHSALALERHRRWSPARFRENSEPGMLAGVGLAFLLLALRPVLVS